MQIDFHHGVIYVLSRFAEFSPQEANVIAYSSQYVDDAVNSGLIKFDNGAMYYHIRSAHGTYDPENTNDEANLHSWLPFHFLPGNEVKNIDEPYGEIARLICRPNSEIAQEMVAKCIIDQNEYNGLHRLGVTLHVYADTWAHQGFIGIVNNINKVENLISHEHDRDYESIFKREYEKVYDIMRNGFVDDFLPLGHGAALSCPDEPYLVWSYKNGLDVRVKINNIEDRYIEAIKEIYKTMKRYQAKNFSADVSDLPENNLKDILNLLKETDSENAEKRHAVWLKKIQDNYFGFGSETINYSPKGFNSWKYAALKTENEKDSSEEIFHFEEDFLQSDWKKFHDAVKEHWDYVMNTLLPKHKVIL